MKKINIIYAILAILILIILLSIYINTKRNINYLYNEKIIQLDNYIFDSDVKNILENIKNTEIEYRSDITYLKNNIENKDIENKLLKSKISYLKNDINNNIIEFSYLKELDDYSIKCIYYYWDISNISSEDLWKKYIDSFTKWKLYNINSNLIKYCIYNRF